MQQLYEQILAGVRSSKALFEAEYTLEELLKELKRRQKKGSKSKSADKFKDIKYDFDYKKTPASSKELGRQPRRYHLDINGKRIVTNAEEAIVDQWLRIYGRTKKEDRKKLYGF